MDKKEILAAIAKITQELDLNAVDDRSTAECLAEVFGVKRNTISHTLNKEIGRRLFKINTRPVRFYDKEAFEKRFFPPDADVYPSIEALVAAGQREKDVLSEMIGGKGSLRSVVEQVKTSVFYPNASLPIFINGPTGVGKSHLVRQIYRFTVDNGILPEGAPFVTLNCAQYANNVELLAANLFGYVKGAFTGANEDAKGLLGAADGGMLFLDEVHRLTGESQEKLFVFLDQGIYRRMGESETWQRANIRMVMATTEDLSAHFLDTFIRRIPVVIKLPGLSQRSYQERLQFIYNFFLAESQVLGKQLSISQDVVDILAGYDYPGNVGELENTIKYLCATTYAKDKSLATIEIRRRHLSPALLASAEEFQAPPAFSRGPGEPAFLTITPETKLGDLMEAGVKDKGFYTGLVEGLCRLYKQEENEQFAQSAWRLIGDTLDKLVHAQSSEGESRMQKYVAAGVHEAFRYVEYTWNVTLGGTVLHTMIAYAFYLLRHPVEHETTADFPDELRTWIQAGYTKEIKVAGALMEMLSLRIDIPVKETDLLILALYFKNLSVSAKGQRPKAMILAHGYATASSIANVVNRLMGENIFEAVDMPIDREVTDVVSWVKDYLEYNDVSNGLLLLVDMGSLADIHRALEGSLRVPLAIADKVSTPMALFAGDLIRREEGLENIVKRLEAVCTPDFAMVYPSVDKQKVLLTCCLTGTGTAEQLRGLIEASVPEGVEIRVLPYDFDDLRREEIVEVLTQSYEVLGIIGTADPKIEELIYIPLEEMVQGETDGKLEGMLGRILSAQEIETMKANLIRNMSMERLMGSLTILDSRKILKEIEGCLERYEIITGGKLTGPEKIRLFIHVGCLVERLIRRTPIEDYPDLDNFVKKHQLELSRIREAFSGIEKTYSVNIPSSELGYIYDILTQDGDKLGAREF